MSFMLTTEQVRNRQKDVTRRIGWWFLRAGEAVRAVEKGQGLKKGEKVKPIANIRIKSARIEKLSDITDAECAREGFPQLRPADFVRMFCAANACKPDVAVNRIEFEYADGATQ